MLLKEETPDYSGRTASARAVRQACQIQQGSYPGYPGQNIRLMDDPATTWSKQRINPGNFCGQPNNWTCGSAVYVMILRVAAGLEVDFNIAVKITGATKKTGTDNLLLYQAFEKLGSDFDIQPSPSEPQTTADQTLLSTGFSSPGLIKIKQLLLDGYHIVVNFRGPVRGNGHYAIVNGINSTAIELTDPWYGRRSVLELNRFDWRSGFSDPVLHEWFVAVRRHPGLDKSYFSG
ncbi:MAG: hypothetical protein R3A13_11970 [Bdellovibrionota bacterium]